MKYQHIFRRSRGFLLLLRLNGVWNHFKRVNQQLPPPYTRLFSNPLSVSVTNSGISLPPAPQIQWACPTPTTVWKSCICQARACAFGGLVRGGVGWWSRYSGHFRFPAVLPIMHWKTSELIRIFTMHNAELKTLHSTTQNNCFSYTPVRTLLFQRVCGFIFEEINSLYIQAFLRNISIKIQIKFLFSFTLSLSEK